MSTPIARTLTRSLLAVGLLLSTAAPAVAAPNPLRAHAHNDPNPVNAKQPKRVAIVVANPTTSTTTGWPVGFWWSELTHPYYLFAEKGYDVEIFSYFGGKVVADAMSDPDDASKWQSEDLISRGFKAHPALMALLADTKPAKAIDAAKFDAIVIAGGQAPMFQFDKATDTVAKFVEFHQKGKIAAALCHGVAVLKYAKLPNGQPLVKGRTVTGFSDAEEDFADLAVWNYNLLPRDKHVMPWRIESEMKRLGANFVQGGLWRSFAVRDGNLITGQQNYSGAATAEAVIKALGE